MEGVHLRKRLDLRCGSAPGQGEADRQPPGSNKQGRFGVQRGSPRTSQRLVSRITLNLRLLIVNLGQQCLVGLYVTRCLPRVPRLPEDSFQGLSSQAGSRFWVVIPPVLCVLTAPPRVLRAKWCRAGKAGHLLEIPRTHDHPAASAAAD